MKRSGKFRKFLAMLLSMSLFVMSFADTGIIGMAAQTGSSEDPVRGGQRLTEKNPS